MASDAAPAPGQLLRDRAFLLFQARTTVAGVGYTVYLATILWLSYELTHGVFLAGLLIAVETAVYTLTFLVSPFVDRVRDKRRVFVACYPLQAAAAFVLGLSFELHRLSPALLVGVVVALAALWDVAWAADQTTARILFGKDRLFAVAGVGGAVGGAIDIVTYVFAGATIAVFGAAGGSYLYAGLLAGAAGLAVLLPIRMTETARAAYLASFREGWTHFRGTAGRALRQLAIVELLVGFFSSGPLLLLTLYVARFFSGSQGTYAGWYVAYLVGGILLGLALGYANPRSRVGALTLLATAGSGAALFAVALARDSFAAEAALWFLVGGVSTVRSTSLANYLQGRFSPELLARIAGNNYVFSGAGAAAGALTIGALSVVLPPVPLTGVVAVGFLGCAAVGVGLPEVRRLGY